MPDVIVKNKEPFDFTYIDNDGESKTLKLALVMPTRGILQKARMEHNKSFAEALKGGAVLRSRLNKYMEDQGMWDDDKENEYKELYSS